MSRPDDLPVVEVQLSGEDGNAFAILGRCGKAARRAGWPKAQIDAFMDEATSDDYDHLLRTAMTWFEAS
jgi:hypothetical protein